MKDWSRPAFSSALKRIDILMHREILRLRASYQLSLDEFRGLYISDQQVDDLILQQASLGQVDTAGLSRSAEELAPQAYAELAQDPQWGSLLRAYALDEREQDLLLLAFLPEIHAKYSILFAYLNNDITRKSPSVEQALNLFSGDEQQDPYRALFAADSRLSREGLIVPLAGQGNSSLQAGFAIGPVLREFLLGHRALDSRIAETCRLLASNGQGADSLPFSPGLKQQFAGFGELIGYGDYVPFFVVQSEPGQGEQELARAALDDAGLGCCLVELKQLLRERDGFSDAVTGLLQTALLEHCGIVISDFALASEQEPLQQAMLGELLKRFSAARLPCFLLVHPKTRWWELLTGHQQLSLSIEAAAVDEREAYWLRSLQAAGMPAQAAEVAAVADYFNLNYAQICAAVGDLSLRGHSGPKNLSREQLFDAARRQSHGDMGELADKVNKDYQIADLVLPPAILARIDELVSAIRSRRLVFEQWDLKRRMGGASGIVAMFAGPSGTGKTMTASVIAKQIGLDLYRIELSGIVSKYIGETEKNLDRIFAAAHKANCILFFDEADALFGKRSEVKDAHDRYANIEVAYLLQKIENHNGIVILTTNLAKSIDQAFTRRMQFIIEFPRPDVALREQLWRGMFGDAVPLSNDVDFNFLARQLENTGGDIKNMVLDAALMAAASDHQVIDMALLVRAAARQMMKQGKVPSAVEFKHYFSLVDERAVREGGA